MPLTPLALAGALLASVCIGAALLPAGWLRRGGPAARRVVGVCMALGLGLGASTLALFAWRLVHGRATPSFVVLEIAVAALCGAVVVRRRRAGGRPGREQRHGRGRAVHPAVVAAFALAAAFAAAQFAYFSWRAPHGRWDSFAVWNMSARFLHRAAGWDLELGAPEWSHPDYPLLVPLAVVRGWLYCGRETVLAPICLAFAVAAATGALLAGAVTLFQGRRQGLLAGTTLLATPSFTFEAAGQTADVPLSMFVLGSVVAFALAARDRRAASRLLLLSGALAGAGAWAKNEGLLLALSLSVAVWVAAHGARSALRPRYFFAGLSLPLLAVAAFKLALAPPSEFIDRDPCAVLALLVRADRWLVVGRAFLRDALWLGSIDVAVPLTPLLAGYALLAGVRAAPRMRPVLGAGALFLALAAAGYACVYVTSPYELEWHLRYSVPRLLLQLWPTVLFLVFLAVSRRRRPHRTRLSPQAVTPA